MCGTRANIGWISVLGPRLTKDPRIARRKLAGADRARLKTMKTVRDACVLQPNALCIKLSDQVEQFDQLIPRCLRAPLQRHSRSRQESLGTVLPRTGEEGRGRETL